MVESLVRLRRSDQSVLRGALHICVCVQVVLLCLHSAEFDRQVQCAIHISYSFDDLGIADSVKRKAGTVYSVALCSNACKIYPPFMAYA